MNVYVIRGNEINNHCVLSVFFREKEAIDFAQKQPIDTAIETWSSPCVQLSTNTGIRYISSSPGTPQTLFEGDA